MRHRNVPVFVPHIGCPQRCSFCNQTAISGTLEPPTPMQVTLLLKQAAQQLGDGVREAEIAFFGGSFTAVEQSYQAMLLEAAAPFLGPGGFRGIRISTRPDFISEAILERLVGYGVCAIELGAQSMDDEVLFINRRGHTAACVEKAARLIRQKGVALGLQMMTGLPGDTPKKALETAKKIAALRPATVRVYPALVLEGTYLAELYRAGEYTPQAVDEAVLLGAELLRFFASENIPVIRFGLHDEPGLGEQALAGPYHPALKELCESKIMLENAMEALARQQLFSGEILLAVHPKCVSRMAGHRRCNLEALKKMGYRPRLVQERQMAPLEVSVRPLLNSATV